MLLDQCHCCVVPRFQRRMLSVVAPEELGCGPVDTVHCSTLDVSLWPCLENVALAATCPAYCEFNLGRDLSDQEWWITQNRYFDALIAAFRRISDHFRAISVPVGVLSCCSGVSPRLLPYILGFANSRGTR